MKKLFRLALLIGLVSASVGSVAAKPTPPPQPILPCDQVRGQSCTIYPPTYCITSMGTVGQCTCHSTMGLICPD